MVDKKFYKCSACGNIIGFILDGGGTLTCCNKPMDILTANSTDAATEKHVPVVTRTGNKLEVQVGSVAHPMDEKHSIQWICVSQGPKTQRIALSPGQEPKSVFDIGAGPAVVFEYCNLHGLWKADC